MASKYDSLTEWLQNCGQDSVRFTFDELQRIITIPPSALRDRPSWANCSSTSATQFQKGWMNAGYVVSSIDLSTGYVVFSLGEGQRRTARVATALRTCQADEEKLSLAIQKGYDFYDRTQNDIHHRYRSWEHCHSAFKQHKHNPASIDRDTLCLHLVWYLASWGMLRNSFLMQKDYRIHSAVVDLLYETEWDELWDISAEALAREENATKIMRLSQRITEAYLENGCGGQPTETLLTKILLGTMGCVPAYDRYFKKAIGSIGAAQQRFSANSLMALSRLYMGHREQFEPLRVHCSQAGFSYPSAKIIDMCFFEYGLSLDETNEMTEE